MSDLDPMFSQGVSDDSSELVSQQSPPPQRGRSRTDQVYRHFKDAWQSYIETGPGHYHSMRILFDSVPAFKTRVKNDLLERDGRSVEDICISIDSFTQALSTRQVTLKPDQPVWKLWWNQRAKYLPTGGISTPAGFDNREYHKRKLAEAEAREAVDRPEAQS